MTIQTTSKQHIGGAMKKRDQREYDGLMVDKPTNSAAPHEISFLE
jgi:hypothetical protein